MDLSFTVDTVERSESRELVWSVAGEQTTQRIIVVQRGDSPRSTETGVTKNVTWVTIPHSIVDGTIVMDPAATTTKIPYTVTVSSTEARDIVMDDVLDPRLTYVDGSLTASKVVRDPDGLNPANTPVTALPEISGDSFTHAFHAEANSVYTFTYQATVAESAVETVRDDFQRVYDAVDKLDGGRYEIRFTNEVTVNGESRTAWMPAYADVQGQGRPNTAGAFAMTADPTTVTLDKPATPGATLDTALPVTYALTADLTAFDGYQGTRAALERNVVIRDTLAEQSAWLTDARDFVTLVNDDGTETMLAPAAGLGGNLEDAIAADEYINTYAVSGTSLFINIGKDVTKRITVHARAEVRSLPTTQAETTQYDDQYRLFNDTYFIYASGRYEPRGATTTVIVPKNVDGGVDDPTRFAKTAPSKTVTVTSGSAAMVPYTFRIGANVGDASSSQIVDALDHSIFDVTEDTLPEIAQSLTGTYGGQPLTAKNFDTWLDGAGDLVIAPNASFPGTAPHLSAWAVTVTLPTHVLQGKQTLDVSNSARYEGSSLETTYTSSSVTRATSFGSELEVRKRVYDSANDTFTSNLRVDTTQGAERASDRFVYRIELIPHGTFSNMVRDVADVLPAGVRFEGFVAPENVASGATTADNPYTVPGSRITVEYDDTTNAVTMKRGRLTADQAVTLYFAVTITSPQVNIGITNSIGATSATITPTDDYPLSLLVRDVTDTTKLVTDSGSRFSVLDAEMRVVDDGLMLSGGRIVHADGSTPVVTAAGNYWLREDVAPAGYERTTSLVRITVQPNGTSADVVLFTAPAAVSEPDATYAVGDVVWIDADRDGIQTGDEQVLPGVTVELLHDGAVVASTITDANGRYVFDERAAGAYQIRFALTQQQSSTYAFTSWSPGNGDAVDSNVDAGTGLTSTVILGPDNENLTTTYPWRQISASEGIDPTWDAGVVVISPDSVGDNDADPGTGGGKPSGPSGGGSAVSNGLPSDAARPGTPAVDALPATGAGVPVIALGVAGMLLLAGAAALFWRRRNPGT
ncbi:SdrD B-like domain-containing protein [Microbacterium sp.]|uniref:SdrD B-like domain-containing protein n=1 Tax=Microbacterium sp. TaxID=51671 RepID=UPI0035672AA8